MTETGEEVEKRECVWAFVHVCFLKNGLKLLLLGSEVVLEDVE